MCTEKKSLSYEILLGLSFVLKLSRGFTGEEVAVNGAILDLEDVLLPTKIDGYCIFELRNWESRWKIYTDDELWMIDRIGRWNYVVSE